MTHEIDDTTGSLTLRDHLALDRTALANERTLLAYLRAGIGLILAGATFVQFGDEPWFLGLGLACVPAGVATAMVGVRRFLRMRADIRRQRGAALPDGQAGA